MEKRIRRLLVSCASLALALVVNAAPAESSSQPRFCWSICTSACPQTNVCKDTCGGLPFCDEAGQSCPNMPYEVTCRFPE